MTKNYFQKRSLRANALWDVSTETGEIASAALVPSTRTEDYAHAATSLTRRPTFVPGIMYSDTWPCKKEFWELLLSKLKGRLGLFHCIQRITKTLKKNHTDHYAAFSSLLHCICHYHDEDHENLLRALKDGKMSKEKLTDEDIADLKVSKLFRQRYGKYLRKVIRPPNIIGSMLDDWFDQYKCSASDDSRPARGRYDPLTGETLFTGDTKEAIERAKEKAEYLQDELPLHQMYDVIQPNVNSKHQLPEYLSRRGESCLESFHGMLAHFGNCGMRTTLADNLNLTGAARYNLVIRHKRRLIALTSENTAREKITAACEGIVSFFNHSELNHINKITIAAGSQFPPFKGTEMLPADNGERFFSEYLLWLKETRPKYDPQSRCLCEVCGTATTTQQPQPQPQPQQQPQQQQPNETTINPPTPTPTAEPTRPKLVPRKNNSTGVRQASVHPNERVERQLPRQQQQTQCQHHQHLQPIHPHQHHPHQMTQMTMATTGCFPPMPNLLTPYPPWMMAAMHTAAHAPPYSGLFCCCRYMCWYGTAGRRGRPPHDDHCPGKIGKQIDNNPNGHAI